MCSVTADFMDDFGSLNMSFPLCLKARWLQLQWHVWTCLCYHCDMIILLCMSVLDSFTDLHFLHGVLAHRWRHNALVKESNISVASFMLTWKSTSPSGNIVLNMDSVWVPLLLPALLHQTLNQCQCLHVWIRVSGCFCNVKAPEWRGEGLPWKCCMITQQTQTVVVTLTTQNYSLQWMTGEEEENVKFQRVSQCVSNLVKTQRREFDRVITHLWFHHLCGWIYYPETGLTWDSVGTCHHLCVTCQAIAEATVCFSLLKYKL